MGDEEAYAGNPGHADHREWLLALGRATLSSQRLAGIMVDVLRIHLDLDFFDAVGLTHGRLVKEIKGRGTTLPGQDEWLTALKPALAVRNDLIHALPVKHGLHRRTNKDRGRVVNFYTVESLLVAEAAMEAARSLGNAMLYHDGGAAVRGMYEDGSTED